MASDESIVELTGITKTFRARRGKRLLLGRGGLTRLLPGQNRQRIKALDDITFDVEPGESLGIIGANGSGKSTLLKIIAGVTAPDEGSLAVRGRVASLLELGAGFHQMLTGAENVYLNAGILGMRHREVDKVFDDILNFAGIGKFIDYPIGTYSSGMHVRLGFAVAAYTNPDIFLIDEVLSVGDEEFQRRCRRRIGELLEQGKTIIFVSHDLGIVNTLCRRVVLMSQGKLILRDTTNKAINFYLRQVGEEKGLHTMRQGPLEAIVCNGRISLFYDQIEVTAASGLQFQFLSYGHWQSGLDADWTILERTDTSCLMRGHLSKLDLIILWEIELEGEELVWSISVECEKPLQADRYEVLMYFPTEYTRWAYDDSNASFPELLPEHTYWYQAMEPDLLCERAELLPEEGAAEPIVSLAVEENRPRMRGSWVNTDYMTGCRVFKFEEHVGGEAGGLGTGTHPVLRMRVRVGGDREGLAKSLGELRQRRAITVGSVTARFDRGALRISYDGAQVTDWWHAYAALQIGDLWNKSTTLRWDYFEREGEKIRVGGYSSRFSFRMEWLLSPVDGGVGIEVWVEAKEDLHVQEHHTSVMLVSGYSGWETEAESGDFPEITGASAEWEYLNREYKPSGMVSASGEGLPTVRLENRNKDLKARMTALNSSFFENARILQALQTPEPGALHLAPGRHLLFQGAILVG